MSRKHFILIKVTVAQHHNYCVNDRNKDYCLFRLAKTRTWSVIWQNTLILLQIQQITISLNFLLAPILCPEQPCNCAVLNLTAFQIWNRINSFSNIITMVKIFNQTYGRYIVLSFLFLLNYYDNLKIKWFWFSI